MSVAQRQFRWMMGAWSVLMLVVMWALPGSAAEFRIAVGVDPDTMDPVQLTTTTVSNMVDYVVDTLTKLVPDGSVEPPPSLPQPPVPRPSPPSTPEALRYPNPS